MSPLCFLNFSKNYTKKVHSLRLPRQILSTLSAIFERNVSFRVSKSYGFVGGQINIVVSALTFDFQTRWNS